MKMYYLELQDKTGQVIFKSYEFFETKLKAKKWAYSNLKFDNDYKDNLFVITCENENEYFNQSHEDISSERVY